MRTYTSIRSMAHEADRKPPFLEGMTYFKSVT
jgi:hypothetical protein